MRRVRYLFLLALLLFIAPTFAQTEMERNLVYGETVGDSFLAEDESHDWQLSVEAREIVSFDLRRIGGVFTPELTVLAPDGSEMIPSRQQGDIYGEQIIFDNGLPVDGEYTVRVTASRITSDGVFTVSEYSLTATQSGQGRVDRNQDLEPIPTIGLESLPDYFTGIASENDLLDLNIYGDVSVSRPNESNEPRRFLLTATRTIIIDNRDPVSRFVESIAFLDDGIAIRALNGAVFFTEQNITDMMIDDGILQITLASGQVIGTDFEETNFILALDDLVVYRMLGNQRLVFDSDTVSLQRRARSSDEAAVAEAVIRILADDAVMDTDLFGWDTLTLFEGDLRVLYVSDLRFLSDATRSVQLFQRGNNAQPQLNAESINTNLIDISVTDEDNQNARFTIDQTGMGDVLIDDGVLSVTALDGRGITQNFDLVSRLLVDNRVIRITNDDDSAILSYPDNTRINIPADVPRDFSAAPNEVGFRPRNFNNLGFTISDYHPQVDMSVALEPVNRINGNFVYPVQDFYLPSHTLGLDWTRTYNSLVPQTLSPEYLSTSNYLLGTFGDGWRHSYQYELDVTYAIFDELRLILPDGSSHIFTPDNNNNRAFRSDSLLSWTIEQIGTTIGSWRAITAEGQVYQFDRAGRLTRIVNNDNHVLLFSPIPRHYLADNEATGGFFVTESYGRRFEVYTNAANQIIQVRDVQGQVITYQYEDDLLVSAIYPGTDFTADYSYDNGRLSQLDDANSPYQQRMSLSYDANGRVNSYINNAGGDVSERVRFNYGIRLTEEIDPAGNVSSWLYDEQFRLTTWNLPRQGWVYRWRYNVDTGLLNEIVQPNRAVLRFTFDEAGYLQTFTDPLFGASAGQYVFSYDSPDGYSRLLTRIDAPSIPSFVELEYDDLNRLILMDEAINNVGERQIQRTEYRYDGFSRLSQVLSQSTGDEALITEYQYDTFGYLNRLEIGTQSQLDNDAALQTWTVQYDIAGRLLNIIDDREIATTIFWNTMREQIARISIDGVDIDYDYDTFGNLIAYNGTSYRYDGLNRLISVTDALRQTTNYSYDGLGNVAQIDLPNDMSIMYDYDALGHLTRQIDAAGLETHYAVDIDTDANRTLYTVTYPSGDSSEYQFDPLGRIRRVTDFDRDNRPTYTYVLAYNLLGYLTSIDEIHNPAGRILTLNYDLLGNPLSSSINDAITTRYEYDNAGNLIRVIDPAGNANSFNYDLLGNAIGATVSDGTQYEYRYDAVGNLIGYVDAIGGEYSYQYDAFNQLIAERDAMSNTQRYAYDDGLNLVTLTDANGNQENYTYDAVGNLTSFENGAGFVTRYAYDTLGNLISVTEPNGLETTFAYDFNNNVVAITQPEDREFLYAWDNLGRLSSITDPLGQTSQLSYNTIGTIGRITDALGNVETFSWQGSGRLLRYAVSNGAEFEYISDSIGRLIGITDLGTDQGTAVNSRFEYDALGNITLIRTGNSNTINSEDAVVSTYTYDNRGRVASYLPPLATVPYQFEYDADNNISRVTDPDGIQTRYVYDSLGNLQAVVHAVGTASETIENYEYDAVGNIIQSTTSDGITRTYEYDAANRLVEVTEIAADTPNRVYQFAYDGNGRVSQMIDPSGLVSIYRYDLFGNLIAVERSQMVDDELVTYTSRYQYDEVDNLIQVQQPEGQIVSLTYNGLSQRVRYIDAENNGWSFTYDDVGNLTQVSNPLGYTQEFNFDVASRLQNIILEQGAEIDLSYDIRGNFNQIRIPNNESIGYSLNRIGDLVTIVHSDEEVIRFERDYAGQIQSIRTLSGETIDFEYDALGRLLAVAVPSEAYRVERTYNDAGQIETIASEDSTIRYTYNGYGEITGFQSANAIVNYNYDTVGNLTERNAAQLGQISYEYDALHRPTRIALGDEWVEITYNNNHWRSSLLRSNGIETLYNYDDNGRVRNIVHVNEEGERLDGFAYEYDAVGNVIRVTRADNWAILYSYDEAQQLLSERWLDARNQLVYSVSYVYDLAGNRTEQIERIGGNNPERTLFTYNSRNQLISETRNAVFDVEDRLAFPFLFALSMSFPSLLMLRRRRRWVFGLLAVAVIGLPLILQAQSQPSITYEYDLDGNMVLARYNDGRELNYDYDVFNRLVAISGETFEGLPKDTTISYNNVGQIARILDNDIAYTFIYEAEDLIAVRSSDSERDLVYFAPTTNETLLVMGASGTFWTIDDGLGISQNMADAEGQIVGDSTGFHVNAFGKPIIVTDTDILTQQQILNEQFYLPNSDIILMGVRAYDARLGRFLQRDWARHDPRGNLYTFAYNSPNNFIDPTGLTTEVAYDGLALDFAVPDPMDFVMRPTVPALPELPNIAQLQASENARILQVAHQAQFGINDVTTQLGQRACDLYLRQANPIPDYSQTLAGEHTILDMYAPTRGWLPNNQPELGNGSLFHQIETLAPTLSNSMQGTVTLNGCEQAIILPDVPTINPNVLYDDLADFRSNLSEITLYPTVTEQVPDLLNLPTEFNVAPQLTVFEIDPSVIPTMQSQLDDLQDETAEFWRTILLPAIREDNFVWQNLYAAQDVSPATAIRVEQ